MPRPPLLTATLCTRCGLCCDGTLFGDVELTGPRETTRLEALGLDVDTDDADVELLSLPCRGLRGTRCNVYVHRPQCCRTFECRLLQDAGRGIVTVDEALARIAEVKAQVLRVTTLLAGNGTAPRPAAAARGARRRRDRRGRSFTRERSAAGRARNGDGRARAHDPDDVSRLTP